jgi:hypothetical protein
MDIVEKRKQYYMANKERIKANNKKYYHDNKAQRQIYNRDYWAIHGHKYIKQRSEDSIYKANQRIYYEKYYEKYKVKEEPVTIENRVKTTQDDLIVIFKFSFY